jgi:hypothetical protein
MGKDEDPCCEACKLYGDAPVADAVPARPLRAAYDHVKLVIWASGVTSEVLPAKAVLVAGRARDADLVFDDSALSRRQFRLSFTDEGVVVEDLNSTCGTYVDGMQTLGPTIVPEGGDIRAGNVVVLVKPR